MNVEPGIQIDLVGALKRRASLVASVAGGVFLVAYWVAMALPNEYTSYATMLIEPPSVNEQLVQSGVAERDLNTRLNLMTSRILSRSRLSALIDQLHLYERESTEMTRSEIVDIMRRSIRVVPVEGALVAGGSDDIEINTFQIYFTYKGFSAPAKVAQQLAQDFIDEHIQERVEVTQKSFEFIESEQKQLARSIRQVEARIAEVKSANTGSLPENLGSNQQHLLFTVGDLRNAQQQLATAQSDESFWGTQNIALAPEGGPTDVASPGRRLQVLELSIAEYTARGFTDKHPDVINTHLEIEAIRASVAQVNDGSAPADRPMSFAQLSVAAEQKRAELRGVAAQNEISRLQKGVEEIQARTAAIPRVAEQLDALQRQWNQLSRNLTDFENRRLKAFVQANLERRQLGEQFRILEPAFPPLGPTSPNRILILAIGAILGLVIGVAVGVGIETLDSSVHAALELQTAISLPVLAAVPTILFESDRVARFRKRLRYSLAAAAVVVFSLAGGAISYVVVNGTPGFLQSLEGTPEEAPVPTSIPTEVEPAQESAGYSSPLPESSVSTIAALRNGRG